MHCEKGEVFKSQRQMTYLRTYAPSEDPDQTAHSRSLIKLFHWAFVLLARDAKFLHEDFEDSDQIE